MKNNLRSTASRGWNIVVMISDNPTIEVNGQIFATDPTPHMGLVDKQKKRLVDIVSLHKRQSEETRIQE